MDARFIFTLIVTLPVLASLVNGMIIFFLGIPIFQTILISALLGLILGGLIGSLYNLVTFSTGAILSCYFGIMGPMISTPIVSSELCGFAAAGGTFANSLSMTLLGILAVALIAFLCRYTYKI
ncbi:hypothetical protein CUU66_17885 [Peribacillus deserti]|uniref:Uncharacterized protein n=1 Tax=Peribacillus deserti TaxID=673318 RepID=A0A2N5M2K8_9BACI|nr:hypothetical protein CUU66_17885 [Peribacillus deserti]